MSGVGKIFCDQPICEVPSPPSRYVWNLIFIRHIYKCISTMSPTICHWTAIAKESTRGGTVSLTVIINWSIPSPTECSSSRLIYIGIPIYHLPHLSMIISLYTDTCWHWRIKIQGWKAGNQPQVTKGCSFIFEPTPIVVIFGSTYCSVVYFMKSRGRIGSTCSSSRRMVGLNVSLVAQV